MAEVVTSPNKALLPAQTTAERPEGSQPPPEMSATQNPLVPPGEFLVAETEPLQTLQAPRGGPIRRSATA